MSTIYVPKTVKGAEELEALPRDTPIFIGPFMAFRHGADKYWTMTLTDGEYTTEELATSFPDYDYVALVPTEVKETSIRDHFGHDRRITHIIYKTSLKESS